MQQARRAANARAGSGRQDRQHRVDVLGIWSARLRRLRRSKDRHAGVTRAPAVELAADHIQVNALLPGWFETDLTRGMPASQLGDQIRRKPPAGRWGTDTDLVGPVVFLASAASDLVTGSVLPVDGGYLIADRIQE